ncbi:apolipoprotein A-II [Tachysurus vachellii]|uniref:apolipoprotein A-II n=1 Tax=Tachysurus vachellii TaxID=175792 RepID=UPI00296A933E|nr:apolipoprotein A-II [Tachysurus vachellii]
MTFVWSQGQVDIGLKGRPYVQIQVVQSSSVSLFFEFHLIRIPTANKMKLALALIVALQVSVCLCEVPAPDQELVDKYEGLKAVFLKRLANAYAAAHTSLEKLAEGTITGEKAKEIAQHAQENERVKALSKLAAVAIEELKPVIEKARLGALGIYGEYLRPYFGIYLDTAINNIKPVLDTWLPAETH